MEKFQGFIVSSARTLEKNASSEIYYVLSELLELKGVSVSPVIGISGISIASFEEDSIKILEKIQEIIQENPIFQYTLKLVPIQYKTSTTLEELQEVARYFNTQINDNTTWRINLRRRHTQILREKIISTIANEIKSGKVMLDSPEHYIIVEIIGKWTYLALSPIPELAIKLIQLDEEESDFTF